jgi:hypothetical protein
MAQARSGSLIEALDDASLNRFHLRAVLVSGMGFFTETRTCSSSGSHRP